MYLGTGKQNSILIESLPHLSPHPYPQSANTITVMPNGVYISEIHISKPNVPLRNKAGEARFSTSMFKIWDHSNPEVCYPVSVPLDSSNRTEIIVTVRSNGEPESGAPFTLTGVLEGNKHATPSFRETPPFELDQDNTAKVPIWLDGYSGSIPWGIKGKVEWVLNGEKTTTPIELYAIAPADILPSYLKNEIPAELLEVFVLPTIGAKVEDYLRYVAAVCHRSTLDEDACSNTKLGIFEPVHSYVYNTIGGSPSYIGGYSGGAFNLHTWLENRYYNRDHSEAIKGNKSLRKTVNCYDQAGLVQITGSLGVLDESLKINYWLLWPCGFINVADLIGVGMCNNPFYEDVDYEYKNGRAIGEHYHTKIVPDDAPKFRSRFNYHAFTVIGSGDSAKVIDACAGPEIGTRTIEQYMDHAIDNNVLTQKPGCSNGKFKPKENPQLQPGVTKLCLKDDSSKKSLSENTTTEVEELHKKGAVEGSIEKDRIYVDFAALVNDLRSESRSTRFAAPSKVSTVDGTTTMHLDSLGGDEGRITIEVQSHVNYKEASDAWASFILSLTEQGHVTFEKPTSGTSKGNRHLVKGSGAGMIVWVYSSVFVKVARLAGGKGGDGEDEELESIADEIESYLKEATTEPAEKHKMGEISTEKSKSGITLDSEFEITVTVGLLS